MNTTEQIIREIEEAIRTGDETYTPPSGMQIHRLFLSEVGYTPTEYLKRRRLSAALARIRASEWKDADIAYACGYSSQQAMCREIRKQIGMTAGQYRKGTDILYFPPYTGSRVCPLTVSKQNIPALTAFHYDASTLTGLETAAVQLFLAANPEYSGRLFGRDGGQIGKRFRYTLYVTDSCTVPDGLIPGETVPAFSAVMAVTSAPDHEPLINAAWDWLYSRWLPNSGYTYAGEYTPTHETAYFEEYLLRNGHPYRLKLYLPLEKSDTFRQIRIETLTCRILACTAAGTDAQTHAGRMLVDCLRERYPYLLQKADRFFVRETDDTCTCGVFCAEETDNPIPPLKRIQWQEKTCLHMELSGGCDPEQVEEILTDWAMGNGFTPVCQPDERFFMAYHTDSNRSDAYLPVK